MSAGRLSLLAECLAYVAQREGITFAKTAALQELHELGTIEIRGSAAYLDGYLLLLSSIGPGENMVDAEPYWELSVSYEPDLDIPFSCDVEAELAGVA